MNMQKFLKEKSPVIKCICGKILTQGLVMIDIEDLGMFLWDRGGKEFFEN